MKTENNTFVDYTYVGNRIHYYKYRKGHSPKSKKPYDTVRSAYLDKLKAKHAGNVYLMTLLLTYVSHRELNYVYVFQLI